MNARAKTFGSPSGEPNTTTRLTLHQKCEKSWTLPDKVLVSGKHTSGTAGGVIVKAMLVTELVENSLATARLSRSLYWSG